MIFKDSRWYDALKYFALIFIPALVMLLNTIGEIWNLPNIPQITATIAAVACSSVLCSRSASPSGIKKTNLRTGSKNHKKTITLTVGNPANAVISTITAFNRFDYESKGRGFESRRAHFPKSL